VNLRTVAAVAAIAALFVLGSLVSRLLYPDRVPMVAELGGETMGTTWSARVVVPEGAVSLVDAARDTITARLERVNRSMSTWDPESEISRFNRLQSTEPFPVTLEFADVVRQADEVSRLTGGAFDVTVAPLVAAWGFGARGAPGRPADPAIVDSARARVGFERLHVAPDGSSLAKDDPRLEIDLSAIAKGYGVDRAAEGLAAIGLASFAIEVGGEVRARGRKPDGSSWSVGIEAPDPDSRRIYRSVDLDDAAIATSGDYRNWYDSDGNRFAHIVDPRTGRPVPWIGFSVTVVHSSATHADAWATGVSVLGPEAGLELADQEGLAVLFVLPDGRGGYRERASAAWERWESGASRSPDEPLELERQTGGKASRASRAAIASTAGTTAGGISWVQNGSPTRKRPARARAPIM
jgi:thiamine biosynthesis lipoprotein